MLEKPSILMLNCVGSYFYSIVKHLSQNGAGDTVLYYLSSGKLTYRNLSVNKIRKEYNENPWGYQPVDIVDIHGQPLEIDESFFNYLSESHGIVVQNLDMNEVDLISCLKITENKNIFYICSVDEYYMPYSEFYHKSHNKHFVLIKKAFYEKSLLEIIDSEVNHTYQITFNEMEEAIYKSIYKRKILYQVDGSSYEFKHHIQKVMYPQLDDVYLRELMKDVGAKLINSSDKPEYFFKGYYYNIVSKIIPYYQMKFDLAKDYSDKYHELYKDLVLEWRNLTKYMRLKIYKKESNYLNFLHKLDAIYCKQKKNL